MFNMLTSDTNTGLGNINDFRNLDEIIISNIQYISKWDDVLTFGKRYSLEKYYPHIYQLYVEALSSGLTRMKRWYSHRNVNIVHKKNRYPCSEFWRKETAKSTEEIMKFTTTTEQQTAIYKNERHITAFCDYRRCRKNQVCNSFFSKVCD